MELLALLIFEGVERIIMWCHVVALILTAISLPFT